MKTINYKGKDYPVKAGYYALSNTTEELKKQGKEMDMNNLMSGDITILEPLLFYSLKMGAHLENERMDIKREDIPFVLDGCFEEFVEMLPEFFPQKKKDEGVQGELKKKNVKK